MILNLTQHPATSAQREQHVVDVPAQLRAELCALLDFNALPSPQEVRDRAAAVAALAADLRDAQIAEDGPNIPSVMIGGAPFFMAPLEHALRAHGFDPVYAFSIRESVEQAQPDGSVRKVNIFRHEGFIAAVEY